MGELHDRGFGFIAVRLDEGEPEPAETPAVESIYTEVLAQELGAARLGVLPARLIDRPDDDTAHSPAGRPGRRRGRMLLTRR